MAASVPSAIPTLTQWGQITLAGLLALGSAAALRRRRKHDRTDR